MLTVTDSFISETPQELSDHLVYRGEVISYIDLTSFHRIINGLQFLLK